VRLLRRRREPRGVPAPGAPPGQRRGGQQHQQVDWDRLHLLAHRRLPQRLLLGPIRHVRRLPDHLRDGACDRLQMLIYVMLFLLACVCSWMLRAWWSCRSRHGSCW
jgi:hypothetical protein